jgi:hypothetical protein
MDLILSYKTMNDECCELIMSSKDTRYSGVDLRYGDMGRKDTLDLLNKFLSEEVPGLGKFEVARDIIVETWNLLLECLHKGAVITKSPFIVDEYNYVYTNNKENIWTFKPRGGKFREILIVKPDTDQGVYYVRGEKSITYHIKGSSMKNTKLLIDLFSDYLENRLIENYGIVLKNSSGQRLSYGIIRQCLFDLVEA